MRSRDEGFLDASDTLYDDLTADPSTLGCGGPLGQQIGSHTPAATRRRGPWISCWPSQTDTPVRRRPRRGELTRRGYDLEARTRSAVADDDDSVPDDEADAVARYDPAWDGASSIAERPRST